MRRQLANTIAYPVFLGGGFVLWGLGLAVVRGLGPAALTPGGAALLYGVSLFVAIAVAFLVRTLSADDRLVEGMAVVALAGLLADAVLLLAYPFAYGPDESVVRRIMAWRAATGAFLLLAGILLEHRPLRK